MKEILFKGRRVDTGDWVCGGYAEVHGKSYIVPWYADGIFGSEVHRSTVCQYTGTVDKDDRKIFEGDIILFDNDFAKLTGEIIFDEDRCGFFAVLDATDRNGRKFGELHDLDFDFLQFTKVIGCIWDGKQHKI